MADDIEVKINQKGLKNEIELMQKFANSQVKVGIQADEEGVYENGASVLDVAIWNEFGTKNIPSRPFIRQCFADNQNAIAQYLGRVVANVVKGKDLHTELSQMGQWYEGKQKQCLLHFPWKPNAASTVKAKGSSKPLVDTSQLVNSIRYKVETNAK